MYLDGNRLKAVAEAQHLSLGDVQQRSRLPIEQVEYYWTCPVSVTSQEDVTTLAHLLHIEPGDLLVQGEPEEVFLRPDKFVWQEDVTSSQTY